MRLASRECSRPRGRREMANTREKSGASSRLSSTYPPTKPLAPASRATLGSVEAMDLEGARLFVFCDELSDPPANTLDPSERLDSCRHAPPFDCSSVPSSSR